MEKIPQEKPEEKSKGGKLEELVHDKEKLKKILNFEIMK